MKAQLILALLFISVTGITQKSSTWIGGTPGNENAWEEPRNWEDGHVPDAFSYVVIESKNSGHYAQPVLSTNAVVAQVEIRGGAVLKITPSGELLVDGTSSYSYGVVLYGGKILNQGNIALHNIQKSNAMALAETETSGSMVMGVVSLY